MFESCRAHSHARSACEDAALSGFAPAVRSPGMVTGLEIFAGILVFLGLYVGLLLPAYVVAVRSGVDSPWLAWVPLVGASIALLRVIGQSGWWALLVLVPYVGALVLDIWLAVEIPRRHARSG